MTRRFRRSQRRISRGAGLRNLSCKGSHTQTLHDKLLPRPISGAVKKDAERQMEATV
jgi:hypothetical protein